MKKSILLAIAITIALALWVASGVVFGPSGEQPVAREGDAELFTVRVRRITAEDYAETIVVRGRTEAVRAVELKAQVQGRVVATPVEKGARVEEGQTICRLDPEEREASLAQARALAAQRQLEYEAAQELAEKGHRSPMQVAQAKALYEAALAQVAEMEVKLAHTRIVAPFAGLVEDRPAHIGAFLQVGSTCARLVDETPYLVVGEVSEREVDALQAGGIAEVKLATGTEATGRIRYVAGTAAERTRTFRIEVAVPNPDRTLREGMTAEIFVPVHTRQAHRVPANALVLDSDGRLGVRTVGEDDTVHFHPVKVLSDGFEGVWVGGLPRMAQVITVGQEFVDEGQRVGVVLAGEEVGG